MIIAKFALSAGGVELSYAKWLIGGVVPGMVSLLLVVYLIYRIYPPEVTHTPLAAQFARGTLTRMGPMSRDERIMLAVFLLIGGLWMTTAWHHFPYTGGGPVRRERSAAHGVLAWEDALGDRQAWDTFIWYGGLINMAEALGDTGVTAGSADAPKGSPPVGAGHRARRSFARLFLRVTTASRASPHISRRCSSHSSL